jgi:hypothetical protein
VREWVAVGEEVTTKMAELLCMQGFDGFRVSKTSAHLIWNGFQLFSSGTIATPHVTIPISALLNLENQITQGF